jgi:hypothetical protein
MKVDQPQQSLLLLHIYAQESTFSIALIPEKDLLILAKDRRIKELELENLRLKEELKDALSKAYDRL